MIEITLLLMLVAFVFGALLGEELKNKRFMDEEEDEHASEFTAKHSKNASDHTDPS